MTNIILFGQARTGKDTLAKSLSTALGMPVYSLAGPIRSEALQNEAWSGMDWETAKAKDPIKLRRHAVQVADVQKSLHGVFHYCKLAPECCIISDGRLHTEMEYAKSQGWLTVKLTNPPFILEPVFNDPSETDLNEMASTLFDVLVDVRDPSSIEVAIQTLKGMIQ